MGSRNIRITWATIEDTSPVFSGSMTVLVVLASFLKASTYYTNDKEEEWKLKYTAP